MKFEYDGDSEQRECVAFIDGDGLLWVGAYCLYDDDVKSVVFTSDDKPHVGDISLKTGMALFGVTKRFYPGDKLTITF